MAATVEAQALPETPSVPSSEPPLPETAQPEEPALVTEPERTPAPIPEPAALPFDPSKVSEELKTATLFDAKALIEKLNAIIQAKDFEAWQGYLTSEYRTYYSDPILLARLSESLVLKRDNIVLRSLKDYFLNVVYRSRQNARVDAIDFVDEAHIIALTINPKGERLVLYYLEKDVDTWKIGIGR